MSIKSSPQELVTEICQHRTINAGLSALVVEGETDCRFFRNVIDEKQCRCFHVNGKSGALKVVGLAKKRQVDGVVAVVDRDFQQLGDPANEEPNVVVTDENDLETTIIRSAAFKKFVNEYFAQLELERVLERTGRQSLSDLVVESAGAVGVLRHLSQQKQWDLNFRDAAPEHFAEAATLEIDRSKLVDHVLELSGAPNVDRVDAMNVFETAMREIAELSHFCCGHDATKLLAHGFANGGWTSEEFRDTHEEVERNLRLVFSDSETGFRNTEMFAALKAWEEVNRPYRVLPVMAK